MGFNSVFKGLISWHQTGVPVTRKVSICCDVVIVLGEDDLLHTFPMYDTTLLGQSMANQIILVANVFQNSIPSPTPKEEINKKG